jgi:hypothetical protein
LARIMKDILLVLNGGDSKNAVERAFRAAQSDSRKVKVLQILDSGLYFYGHNDLVAPRLSKRTYLLYIREQVIEQGKIEACEIRERARDMGVSLEINPVETDDVVSTVIAEAKRGYEKIFLPKEKKKLFPIIKRNVEKHLKRKVSSPIISC